MPDPLTTPTPAPSSASPERTDGARRRVLVGLPDAHAQHVLRVGLWYAEHFGADLCCATVIRTPVTPGESPLGPLVDVSPDGDPEPVLPEDIAAMVRAEVAERELDVTTFCTIGAPARELSRHAEDIDALMIVVGTREGMRGSVREFVNGSVAAQLAHRQHRPVVVVPLDPVAQNAPAPWEQTPDPA